MKTPDMWYARASIVNVQKLLRSQANRSRIRRFDKTVGKGMRKDSTRAFETLAVVLESEARIRPDPPLIVPIEDLISRPRVRRRELAARKLLDSYRRNLGGDRRRLLERHRYADLARKVVAVGSVGTRGWVILLLGRDPSDPLFLQARQAPRSVLEVFDRAVADFAEDYADQNERDHAALLQAVATGRVRAEQEL